MRPCVRRDMRRLGSSTGKTEGEGFLDVKLGRTHNGQHLHAADGKSKLLSESAAAGW